MVRNKLLILKTNTLYWGGGGGEVRQEMFMCLSTSTEETENVVLP